MTLFPLQLRVGFNERFLGEHISLRQCPLHRIHSVSPGSFSPFGLSIGFISQLMSWVKNVFSIKRNNIKYHSVLLIGAVRDTEREKAGRGRVS